jgi:peptidoglycan-N-acetylglucosamine deacetylase
MSRLPPEIVGLLVVVLVLGVAVVASGEHTARTGAVGVSPSAIAPAPPTAGADEAPAAEPLRTQAPAPRKPRSQPSRPKAPSRSKEKFQPNMPRAKSGGIVYLTFDDGPSHYTPAILKILRTTHSTATFFELGFRQAEHPAEAAQVRATGNNIGNHTYSHPDLTTLTAGEIRSEVARGPRSGCLRPPFGATDPTVQRILAQEGLREVLWTTDTKDWSRPGSRKIVKAATAPTVGAGSIVLLHDGGGDRSQTVAALPQIISILQQRGYVVRRIPGC